MLNSPTAFLRSPEDSLFAAYPDLNFNQFNLSTKIKNNEINLEEIEILINNYERFISLQIDSNTHALFLKQLAILQIFYYKNAELGKRYASEFLTHPNRIEEQESIAKLLLLEAKFLDHDFIAKVSDFEIDSHSLSEEEKVKLSLLKAEHYRREIKLAIELKNKEKINELREEMRAQLLCAARPLLDLPNESEVRHQLMFLYYEINAKLKIMLNTESIQNIEFAIKMIDEDALLPLTESNFNESEFYVRLELLWFQYFLTNDINLDNALQHRRNIFLKLNSRNNDFSDLFREYCFREMIEQLNASNQFTSALNMIEQLLDGKWSRNFSLWLQKEHCYSALLVKIDNEEQCDIYPFSLESVDMILTSLEGSPMYYQNFLALLATEHLQNYFENESSDNENEAKLALKVIYMMQKISSYRDNDEVQVWKALINLKLFVLTSKPLYQASYLHESGKIVDPVKVRVVTAYKKKLLGQESDYNISQLPTLFPPSVRQTRPKFIRPSHSIFRIHHD